MHVCDIMDVASSKMKCLSFRNGELPVCHIVRSRNFLYHQHRHRGFFEIDYCMEGQLIQVLNGKKNVMMPGSLLVVREKDTHSLRGTDVKFANIVLAADLLDGSRHASELLSTKNNPYVMIPERRRPEFEALIGELVEKQDTPERELIFHRFFYDVLIEWFVPRMPVTNQRIPEWLKQGLAELEKMEAATWSPSILVKCCCKSREHVARTFQAVLGVSMSRYMNDMKLTKAKTQLLYTNTEIVDICFDAGFNNINYFYRLFKKRFMMTPGNYRKKHTSQKYILHSRLLSKP